MLLFAQKPRSQTMLSSVQYQTNYFGLLVTLLILGGQLIVAQTCGAGCDVAGRDVRQLVDANAVRTIVVARVPAVYRNTSFALARQVDASMLRAT